jgi:putative ABC transport system ATP-binding protein
VRQEGGEEAIVVGRGGWLRLPEEFLRRAGIASRATASFEAGSILVSSPEGAPTPLGATGAKSVARPVGEPVVEIRGLAKSFGEGDTRRTVFAGFDAAVREGGVTALTGPSGSGKTTLLRIVAGLELPDAGEVVALGRRLDGLDRAERAEFRRRHVAVVGQEVVLVPFLSARENVELGLSIRNVPPAEARRQALEALDAVGLAALAERRVARLSAGEAERVAIARALASRPALLLADEPTARLDQANAIAVGALLARWAHESGAAVLCATHDRVLIEQADTELTLSGGAGAAPAPPQGHRATVALTGGFSAPGSPPA